MYRAWVSAFLPNSLPTPIRACPRPIPPGQVFPHTWQRKCKINVPAVFRILQGQPGECRSVELAEEESREPWANPRNQWCWWKQRPELRRIPRLLRGERREEEARGPVWGGGSAGSLRRGWQESEERKHQEHKWCFEDRSCVWNCPLLGEGPGSGRAGSAWLCPGGWRWGQLVGQWPLSCPRAGGPGIMTESKRIYIGWFPEWFSSQNMTQNASNQLDSEDICDQNLCTSFSPARTCSRVFELKNRFKEWWKILWEKRKPKLPTSCL